MQHLSSPPPSARCLSAPGAAKGRLRSRPGLFALAVRLALASALGSVFTSTVACNDSPLAVERQRFLGFFEIATGRVVRHSEAFHRWRVEARRPELDAADTKAETFVAVGSSLAALGRHDEADAVFRRLADKHPNHWDGYLAWSLARLRANDLDAALAHVSQARAIDPETPWSRDKVLKDIIGHAIESRAKQPGGPTLPILPASLRDAARAEANATDKAWPAPPGFFGYVLRQHGVDPIVVEDDLQFVSIDLLRRATLKGLKGLLYFDEPDSPMFLEALADTLDFNHPRRAGFDAPGLAARAYLRAGLLAGDQAGKLAYYDLAKGVTGPRRLEMGLLEDSFRQELDLANIWYDGLRNDEERWVGSGGDVEAMFERKYYKPSRYRAWTEDDEG